VDQPLYKTILSYVNVIKSIPESQEKIVTIKRPIVTPPGQTMNYLLDRQRNRIKTSEVIEKSKKTSRYRRY